MRMKRRLQSMLFILCACLLLAGCGNNDNEKNDRRYFIYYTNTEATKVTPVAYEPETKIAEDMVNEFLMQLAMPPRETDTKVAKPESVAVKKAELIEHTLSLYFSESYSEMDPVSEVLCRAAYVRTLAQIPGVEEVEFYVGKAPLVDAKNVKIGVMRAEDFIENTDQEMDAYDRKEITLYFADKEGAKLIPVTVSAILGTNVSTEKIIVERLLKGPGEDVRGVCATMPEGTKLLNVSTDDGVCYVNLSEEFLKPLPEVTGLVSLYSIVNSLCELPTVNKVQFAINGDTEKTYYEDISFTVPFEKNTELITQKKSSKS